jgi:hypothetical protein
MAISFRNVASQLDPINPPNSFRGLLARQPWIPVEASTGIPRLPVSCRAVLHASSDGQQAAAARLAILVKNLESAVNSLGIPDSPLQAGPASTEAHGLKVYRRFTMALGYACAEIWGSSPHDLNEAWIAVPRSGLGGQPDAALVPEIVVYPIFWQWFLYRWDAASSDFRPADQGLVSSPYPPLPSEQRPPRVEAIGDWSHRSAYGTFDVAGDWLGTGSDPHWVPILVGNQNPWIRDIHVSMQDPKTQQKGIDLLNQARPANDVDIKERTKNNPFQPVTLRGSIRSAGWPGGDFGYHHTTGYSHNSDVSRGPFAEVHYPFVGSDWDMEVIPDADVPYLLSKAWYESKYPNGYMVDHVRIEIEHFTLGSPVRLVGANLQPYPYGHGFLDFGPQDAPQHSPYYPRDGMWIQATGRWVIDTGHPQPLDPNSKAFKDLKAADPGVVYADDLVNGFPTEIHPPELMVASATGLARVGPSLAPETYREAVVASVGATGASLHDLDFVICPPFRPSPLAKLRYGIFNAQGMVDSYDRKDGGDLTISPSPNSENPNQLRGNIRWHFSPTSESPILLFGSGMIGQTSQRGLQVMVRAWWDDSARPRGKIVGQLVAQPTDVISDLNHPPGGVLIFYRETKFADGVFWSAVVTNSEGNFVIPDLTFGTYLLRPAAGGWIFPNAPIVVDLQQTEIRVTIQAQNTATPSQQVEAARLAVPPSAAEATKRWQASHKLIRISEPSSLLGTAQNRRGLPHASIVIVHLAAIFLEAGGLVAEASGAINLSTDDKRLRLIPVVNGRVEVILWLRRGDRFVVVASASANTDAQGYAHFMLKAGANPQIGYCDARILENPANPWFLGVATGRTHIFHPESRPDVVHDAYGLVALPVLSRGLADRRVLANVGLSATDIARIRMFVERAQRKIAKSFGGQSNGSSDHAIAVIPFKKD